AAAGGEYVPLAWVDGGAFVALVHDSGARPAGLVAPSAPMRTIEAEPVAASLVDFLDALIPQTVCRFTGASGASATMELVGETVLLIERHGEVSRREFASADEVGEYVATFIADALDAGL